LSKIGEGAFGVVYRAKWRDANVAVKQLLSQGVSTEQLKAFLAEVQLIQELRAHPNVVMFLGTTIPPQPLSLVTEFCEGGSLDVYLKKNKNDITPELQEKFILGIALGMRHLHAEKIIHRDLAARNVLLNANLDVKISDFGMSRQHDEAASEGKTTSTVGPLKWMAPESIKNQTYSTKSDVWSYGVVVYEILKCSEPFPDSNALQAAMEIVNGKRLTISEEWDSVHTNLMRACWQEQPAFRPSMAEIICMLTKSAYESINDARDDAGHSDVEPLPQQPELNAVDGTTYQAFQPPQFSNRRPGLPKAISDS